MTHQELLPAALQPHVHAICKFMESLPIDHVRAVGQFFTEYAERCVQFQQQNDDCTVAQALETIVPVGDVTKLRHFLWAARIEPTDENVMMAALAFDQHHKDLVAPLS
ncbi:MAG: hypothetical protein LAO51_10740 [Acidobacteriia bacterium]|nr:hypothetical protein [Terriglobia bacterium]